ncbi:ATP-binding protein [Candidatus Methylomirabilis sp.]|uniref:ATP-binding protein n=1 Tax=Candidatus Methylomirabilis sp. TaxID=2032687 RepID=UPI002A5B7171|nr:ATP-binding protein [Candidatus Methylomirabilis sp.]
MTIRVRLLLGFGLVCLTMMAAPLTIYMVQSIRALQSAGLKYAGIAPSRALLRMVQLQQQHRGLSSGVLGGHTEMEAQRAAKQAEADQAVEAFDAMVASRIHDPALTADWRRAAEAWKRLARGVASHSISGQESVVGHAALIGDDLKLLDLLLDYFGLSYDPTGHDYHLTMALLVHMPMLTEFLGQARVHGALLLAERRITLADRTALIGLIGNVERQHEYMTRELDKAMVLNPQMKTDLGGIAQVSRALAQKAIDLARTQVVEAERLSYAPADYLALFTQVIDGQFALLDHAMLDLEGALQARLAALRRGQDKTIAFMAAVVALAVWLAAVIVRATKRDIIALQQSEEAQRRHASELEATVEERTRTLKHTQAQLIQSGKLAAVGTLAAGVAHELNQPLMIIRGYAQELLRDERIGEEAIRDDLRRIEAQTGRMTAIINHLRDFSRESKGKRQDTDLNRVVTDALDFLGQQLKTQHIDVVQELHPALPTVRVDPLQIEQILLNLITNARDAMEAAAFGTITIRTECAQGDRVALSVTDTGPGIPEEIRTRIFDPFFTTKEVGKGTGLGLSICHGIIEKHGGELIMASPVSDGKGARFTIILPPA